MSKTYQNHLSSANQCFEYSEPHPTRLAEHLMLFLGLLPLSQGGAEGPVGLSWSSVPWAPSSCRGAFGPCPGGTFRCSCQVGMKPLMRRRAWVREPAALRAPPWPASPGTATCRPSGFAFQSQSISFRATYQDTHYSTLVSYSGANILLFLADKKNGCVM